MTHKRKTRTSQPFKAEYFNPVKDLMNEVSGRAENVTTRKAVLPNAVNDFYANQHRNFMSYLHHSRSGQQVISIATPLVCRVRKARRAALFANKKIGKGKGIHTKKRLTLLSKVRCI